MNYRDWSRLEVIDACSTRSFRGGVFGTQGPRLSLVLTSADLSSISDFQNDLSRLRRDQEGPILDQGPGEDLKLLRHEDTCRWAVPTTKKMELQRRDVEASSYIHTEQRLISIVLANVKRVIDHQRPLSWQSGYHHRSSFANLDQENTIWIGARMRRTAVSALAPKSISAEAGR